jgi:RimJ/RimL family protein N-acetyltransferase
MPASTPSPRILRGRFITLEPLSPSDADELYEAIGHPSVFAGGYGGGPAGFAPTIQGFRDFVARYYPWDRGITYGARLQGGPEAGRLVGTSTLSDFDEAREHAHIGWTAWSPTVWGTAVNPEAKLLMLSEAFDHGFGRVKLQADALNSRSRAAILKLGATFEGIVRRDMLRADATWRDSAVYSVTIDDWPGVRSALQERLERFEGPVTPASADDRAGHGD